MAGADSAADSAVADSAVADSAVAKPPIDFENMQDVGAGVGDVHTVGRRTDPGEHALTR